ncbi:MAG: single-stranded-DNA-specific exonuclease RecJ [Opitutales bacterium]|nr:single-stranded-DNA-specific exonuclease RecJ [Opitutales bacterium]
MLWIEEQIDAPSVKDLSSELGCSPLLSKLLLARGLSSVEKADSFLYPKLNHLTDPFKVPNLINACKRICQSLEKKDKILIVGDYDVDGITSTVIVSTIIQAFGLVPHYVIPHRIEEGYGLTKDVLERGMKREKIDLVIALDCGTNSFEEASFLEEQGIDLVIIDHHQSKGNIHQYPTILNPHLHDQEGTDWTNLCTAGLCFKLVHGIIKYLREKKNEIALTLSPKDYLSLTALGTLADMVPLEGENRILTKYGLKHLRHNPSVGLETLIKLAKFDTRFPFDSEDITFRIAPRINACGRLNQPEVAAQLLLCQDAANATKLAKKMDDFNEERKSIEAKLTETAHSLAEQKFASSSAVVIAGEGKEWNPGVVGIVAGKLANSLNKPCIVLAYDNGRYKGSGRGIAGINLVKALASCSDLLEHWGGHPVAVGLTVCKTKIDDFISAFTNFLDIDSNNQIQDPSLQIDAVLNASDIDDELLNEIGMIGPFGQENREPTFALKEIILDTKPRPVGNGEHFQFRVKNGDQSIAGIAWKMKDRIPPVHTKIDLAFRLKWNRWNNQNTPQMVLKDWKVSEEPK